MTQVIYTHRHKADKNAVINCIGLFWRDFRFAVTKESKIRLLKSASGRLIGDPNLQYKRSIRKQFNKKKKKFAWGNCKVCDKPAQLLHHIVQIQNGGHNHRKNLIPLCHDCHAEVHPWLKGPKCTEKYELTSKPATESLTAYPALGTDLRRAASLKC